MLLAQAQRSVLHPLDTIKSRLQYLRDTTPRAQSGWRKVPILADIAGMAQWPREHFTPRSLYRGLLPSLLGALPMSLVYMPTYELSKQALAQTPAAPLAGVVTGAVPASLPGPRPPTPPPAQALSSRPVAQVTACVRVPISVVKARVQLQLYDGPLAALREP